MVKYSTVYVEFTFLYLKVRVNDEKQGGSARWRLVSNIVVSGHDIGRNGVHWHCTVHCTELFFGEFFSVTSLQCSY
jgi:hypothetical protein